MRILLGGGLTALAVLLGLDSTALAQVSVRAPFVNVQVGPPGVYVGVFGRPVVVVPSSPAPVYRERISKRSGEVLPAPRPVPEIDETVPSLAEFVNSFRPHKGTYEITIVHPVTNQPVSVRFTLPSGKPQQVRLNRRELSFDYGNQEVAIRFMRDGRVRVLYD